LAAEVVVHKVTCLVDLTKVILFPPLVHISSQQIVT
jgi:hypothetical protein